MMYHLSPQDGIVSCIHKVFVFVSTFSTNHKIVYINNSTPGALRKAISESREAWVANLEMMKAFHYERVTSLAELLALLEQHYDLVIIEHLDHIVQEPSDLDYPTQNKVLAEVLAKADGAIFIDDWDYLRRYYLFEELKV